MMVREQTVPHPKNVLRSIMKHGDKDVLMKIYRTDSVLRLTAMANSLSKITDAECSYHYNLHFNG